MRTHRNSTTENPEQKISGAISVSPHVCLPLGFNFDF